LFATALTSLLTGNAASNLQGTIGALIIFVGAGCGGGWLARRNLGGPRGGAPHSEFEREQAILALAETSQGLLTIAEVAAHCHISLDDSKRALDRLVLQRVADPRVADNGTLVYAFPGFLSEQEKASAEEI
jgi:hypothetical protein